MAANKTSRGAVLRSMRAAVKANLIVPDELFWSLPVARWEIHVPPLRGYVAGGCVDEAQLRAQAEAGRELMRELLTCSN